jgi:hypothetical protein
LHLSYFLYVLCISPITFFLFSSHK